MILFESFVANSNDSIKVKNIYEGCGGREMGESTISQKSVFQLLIFFFFVFYLSGNK